MEKIIIELQNILKNKSTTFMRKTFNAYCKDIKIPERTFGKPQDKWYLSQWDCRHRNRTICVCFDGKNELELALRKKAGYYFLIEYNRHRIFECEPNVIVLEEDILREILTKYRELFKRLFDNPELLQEVDK